MGNHSLSSGQIHFISPEWPTPARVHACTTLRRGGVSQGAYASLNLAQHVADDIEAVDENRRRLAAALALPAEPCWLEQVHGHEVVYLDGSARGQKADAAWTDRKGVVCVVLTADCLPIVVCDRAGAHVAVIHAGWRSLAAGIIEQTLAALPVGAEQLLVWLGPAIGPQSFEVGADVREAFLQHDVKAAQAFKAHGSGRWLADLYQLARQRLQRLAVGEVTGGDRCTYRQQEDFFSHRRDGLSGRLATLIWLE